MEGTPIAVRDDAEGRRLVFELEGHEAFLEYRVRNGEIVLAHTEVPDALGGRGLAGALVGAALDKAQAEGLTVAPWCPYARSWLQDNPGEAGRVTINWAEPPR